MPAKLSEGKLINAFGNLSQYGYATSFLREYERRDIKIKKLKIKESDLYYFGNSRYAVMLKIADYSSYAYGMVSVIDFEKNTVTSKKVTKMFSCGKTKMPKTSKIGDAVFNEKDLNMRISNDGITRRISCKLDKFDGVADFECNVELLQSGQESLTVVTPFKNKKQFRYSQIISSLKVRGTARVGGRKLVFSELDSLGSLKWERSFLPYKLSMTSAVMSGIHNGKNIAFNFMTNVGKDDKLTENVIFSEKKAYKIDYVNIEPTVNEKGKPLVMEEWNIFSTNKEVKLVFKPLTNKKIKTDLLVIKDTNNYIYGYFSGIIKVNDKDIKIEEILGYIDISKIQG